MLDPTLMFWIPCEEAGPWGGRLAGGSSRRGGRGGTQRRASPRVAGASSAGPSATRRAGFRLREGGGAWPLPLPRASAHRVTLVVPPARRLGPSPAALREVCDARRRGSPWDSSPARAELSPLPCESSPSPISAPPLRMQGHC